MTEAVPTAAPPAGERLGGSSAFGGYFADPDLRVVGDRYWLFPTTDGSVDWSATSFRAFSSTDLERWTDHGDVLRLGVDVRWASEHAWAPTTVWRDDRQYLYFTAADHIGVAIADGPLGPYRDLGRPLVAPGDFAGRAIDPAVFVDHDGAHYLLWGNGVAHIVRLADDMTSFSAREVQSWTPSDFREAAWMHRRGGLYYLSWSVDDTRAPGYHVRYATGPSPFGPWTDQGILIEQEPARGVYATGHHSILNVPGTDDWVIAYHRFAVPDGDGFHREVAFDRLIHRADGLIEKVTPSLEPLRIPLHHQ